MTPTGDTGSEDLPDRAELALLLRAERPQPDPGWAARLDQRAAAGFPRGGIRSSRRRPGGWLAPAGALAALMLVVVVVAVNNGGSGGGIPDSAAPKPTSTAAAPSDGGRQVARLKLFSGSVAAEAGTASRADAGKIAPGAGNRRVDRDAQLSLSARPDEVRGVADEVIAITRSLDGIVASSQITERAGGASASLQLTIPTRNLDAALDRLTELADVDSLNETATDITKPVISARDELRDAEARRRELLQALGNAATAAEADALTLKIADARREIARAEAAYERVARKARLSELAVTVRSDADAGDERTLGDWLDDAVSVLETTAGVLLIALVIVAPVGLLAALVAAVVARVRRRRRERALDG